MANRWLVTVAVPPRSTQFWFWAMGRRVAPLYRPWVAEQIVSRDYTRRRLWPLLAIQAVLVVIPQTVLVFTSHNRVQFIAPVALLVFYIGYAGYATLRPKPISAPMRRRLLAYHGVTADGTLTEPVSAWSLWATNPFGKSGLALFVVQVVVFVSGVTIAADWTIARRACHVLPAADAAALSTVVGQPVPEAAAAFGAPAPIVAPEARLIAAREVDAGIPGIHYVAAYVPGPSGRLIGPAVWRVIDPRTVLNADVVVHVDAQDFLARQITPTTGYSSSQPPDRRLDQARDCAKRAR
jgi:hypothetical protein